MAKPNEVASRAEALAAAGVDGIFTFEGPHDVFLPLILAADTGCHLYTCLLYTSDAADDLLCVDLGGRRIIKKKNKIDTTTNPTIPNLRYHRLKHANTTTMHIH